MSLSPPLTLTRWCDGTQDNVPLSSFVHIFGRSVYSVNPNCNLDALLQIFRMESTHLALVKQSAVLLPSATVGPVRPNSRSHRQADVGDV